MADITQQEIARRLNISTTTVSRCFTHHPKISPETRAAVLSLAAQMGYTYFPRREPRRRTSGRSRQIAVLVALADWQIPRADTVSQTLQGISEYASSADLQIRVHYFDPREFEPSLRSRRIVKGVNISDWSGALLIYPFKEEAVKALMGRLPVLSILDEYDRLGLDCVEPDQRHGFLALVEHLRELGHTKIGFLSWRYLVPAHWVEHRLGSYMQGLYVGGLPVDMANILDGSDGPDPALVPEPERVEWLADRVVERIRAGVTAFVCAADHQAYHLIGALNRRGIRVPEDCSLTGFDGVPPPEGLPQLTTVAVSLRDIGISAMHELERKIKDPTLHRRRHVLVAGEFVKGRTTAPPPKK